MVLPSERSGCVCQYESKDMSRQHSYPSHHESQYEQQLWEIVDEFGPEDCQKLAYLVSAHEVAPSSSLPLSPSGRDNPG